MFDDPWLLNTVKQEAVDQKVQLDISANLASFRKASIFQSGVLSFMANLQTSADELEDLKKMFIKLDSSKDGYLSVDELRQGFKEVFGDFVDGEMDYDDMIKAVDTNGDGQIDYDEFIAAAFNRQKLLNKKNLETAFKIFDSDGNGQITMDELKAVFAGGQAADSQSSSSSKENIWEQVMKEADKDNDNQISFTEFTEAMESVIRQRATILQRIQNQE